MSEDSQSKLSKMRGRWKIYLFAGVVGVVVMIFAGGADKPTITTAAQNIIQLAAFLAAASGVLTAIYLGQILKEIPGILRKSVPSGATTIERQVIDAVTKDTTALLSPRGRFYTNTTSYRQSLQRLDG